MVSNELIIDDDYCKAMGTYFLKQEEEIDELISKYLSILQEIKDKAIISGDVSDALTVYLAYVQKLTNHFGVISLSIKSQIDKFLERVDSEDQYLF